MTKSFFLGFPYPLVWRCLKESGVTAFFTRSSATNIPVNMELWWIFLLPSYSASWPVLFAATAEFYEWKKQGKGIGSSDSLWFQNLPTILLYVPKSVKIGTRSCLVSQNGV